MKTQILQLIEDTKVELGKVEWPNRSKVSTLVVVVLVVVFLVSMYVSLLDLIFGYLFATVARFF